MRSLIYNLVADADGSFHIGDDRIWQKQELRDYIDFNTRQAIGGFRKLISRPECRERLGRFAEAHQEPEQVRAVLGEP